jgi:antitoxin ParD1/3/4
MNVSLTDALESFVEEKVRSGTFTSASEVVRAGLRLLQEHDAEHAARLAGLRQDIVSAREQIRRGDSQAGPATFERLRKSRSHRDESK